MRKTTPLFLLQTKAQIEGHCLCMANGGNLWFRDCWPQSTESTVIHYHDCFQNASKSQSSRGHKMPMFRGVAKSGTIEAGPKKLRFHASPIKTRALLNPHHLFHPSPHPFPSGNHQFESISWFVSLSFFLCSFVLFLKCHGSLY